MFDCVQGSKKGGEGEREGEQRGVSGLPRVEPKVVIAVN